MCILSFKKLYCITEEYTIESKLLGLVFYFIRHQPKAAAVQWAIMKPELSPPSLTRKAGSSLREGLHSLSILLSLIEASSWTAMAKKSRA